MMKIGLLRCVHLDEKLVEKYGSYPDMFVEVFRATTPKPEFIVYDVLEGELPENIDLCDGYLITGSPAGVNDDLPWIHALEAFILKLWQQQKKLIGVCFGHQLIAKVFGGKVMKSHKGWGVGMSVSQLNQKKSWMQPEMKQFNLLNSHQDQIVQLPKDAELLAQNDHCQYYMMQLGECILSVQGHPELNQEFLRALMETRKNVIDPECYQQGLDSLAMRNDNRLIAQWIVNFINE